MGQSWQCGVLGVQTTAPNSIRAWLKSPGRSTSTHVSAKSLQHMTSQVKHDQSDQSPVEVTRMRSRLHVPQLFSGCLGAALISDNSLARKNPNHIPINNTSHLNNHFRAYYLLREWWTFSKVYQNGCHSVMMHP